MPTCFGTMPDYRRIQSVLKRQLPDRLPLYEFFSDGGVQLAAIGSWPMNDLLELGDNYDWNIHIKCQYYLGYDYLSPWVHYGFTGLSYTESKDSEGNSRHYVNDGAAPIKSRAHLEKYNWPKPQEVDYSVLDYCTKYLPEGMKAICNLGGGLLEWGMWLMGAEDFCIAIYDDTDLVQELLMHINRQQVEVAKTVASHPDVIAVAMGDDMGFKTQTFLPPETLQRLIFPGLKNIADAIHSKGKHFILHSCGNLSLIMDDLIDWVGIDAKHSFEDAIMPIDEAQELWGEKIALLGGVDIDFLGRASENELRKYIRHIIDKCAPRGGFAIGSGNSIANYVPPNNLRIMIQEALSYNN